ncbi:MAG: SMP-30/gluconolactonase/LRE family protein, partial [Ignavibacteriaceae bacterium]
LQPEGPVWKDSVGLLFSDIQANVIYLWSQQDSSLKIYLQHSDSSNGLTFDHEGRLVLTQMELRRVAREEKDGTIIPLASTFRGKKFNSPNDLAVKSDGSIFFTDPDFNIPFPQTSELHFQGIYRIDTSGSIKLLDSTFDKPNGICFSPDEKKLYVNDSHKCQIYVWDIVNDSTIENKKLFYQIPATGYADGMKVDSAGNIYCTGPTGVWIISPEGKYLDKIAMTENPSNCNWGDADGNTLYITAGKSLYKIRMAAATAVKEHGSLNIKTYKLYANYPNPFNPSTTITFDLLKGQNVKLKIFDILGNEQETLLNGYLSAGTHSVRFNAESFPSGVYMYQMEAGNIVQSKKMVLLR